MRTFIFSFFLLASLVASSQMPAVFSKDGKAMHGYDVVEFFRSGKAVPGQDSLKFTWNDAQWYFATVANLDSFRIHPVAYAPRYGGYCAYGMASGYKAPTEVDTWTIYEGKLYFNYNGKVKSAWMKNREALVMKADENWLQLKDK